MILDFVTQDDKCSEVVNGIIDNPYCLAGTCKLGGFFDDSRAYITQADKGSKVRLCLFIVIGNKVIQKSTSNGSRTD